MIIYQVALPTDGSQGFHATLAAAHAQARQVPHAMQEIYQHEVAVDKEAVIAMLNGGPYKDWKMQRRWKLKGKKAVLQEIGLDEPHTPEQERAENDGRRFPQPEVKAAALQGSQFTAADFPPSEPHVVSEAVGHATRHRGPLENAELNADGQIDLDDPHTQALLAKSSPAMRPLSEEEQRAMDEFRNKHKPPTGKK